MMSHMLEHRLVAYASQKIDRSQIREEAASMNRDGAIVRLRHALLRKARQLISYK